MASQQSGVGGSGSCWPRLPAAPCSPGTSHLKSQMWDNLHFQGEIRWREKEEPAVLSSCMGLEKKPQQLQQKMIMGSLLVITMGWSQLFRQTVLREWQPLPSHTLVRLKSQLSFLPSVTWQADVTADEKWIRSWGCNENWLCCTLVSVFALLLGYFYWWSEVLHTIKLSFHATYDNRQKAWQMIITFIYNWLMCTVDSMCSFLKRGEKGVRFQFQRFCYVLL